METVQKLERLAAAASFDVCGYGNSNRRSDLPHFLYRATLPDGNVLCLLKVLLTDACINDCAYCANRAAMDFPRHAFQPEELASIFMDLHSRNAVHGLFLSSGIAGNASKTMQSMIAVAEILRHRYHYRGYIHLKILPGATFDCVEQACKLANRVSVNIEAPSAHHLARLTSKKDIYRDILQRMKWIKQLSAADERVIPSGQTTQFVVGAAGETDWEILSTTCFLYQEMRLKRVYFSAYRPVIGSPLEGVPPTPAARENRLYQADWLMRVYGFRLDEIRLALEDDGNLTLSADPKTAIARKQPWLFPVDVNLASYEQLVRVPGIGPVAARRIIKTRREHSIFSTSQLRKMGVILSKAAPFIHFKGFQKTEQQPSLFDHSGLT